MEGGREEEGPTRAFFLKAQENAAGHQLLSPLGRVRTASPRFLRENLPLQPPAALRSARSLRARHLRSAPGEQFANHVKASVSVPAVQLVVPSTKTLTGARVCSVPRLSRRTSAHLLDRERRCSTREAVFFPAWRRDSRNVHVSPSRSSRGVAGARGRLRSADSRRSPDQNGDHRPVESVHIGQVLHGAAEILGDGAQSSRYRASVLSETVVHSALSKYGHIRRAVDRL